MKLRMRIYSINLMLALCISVVGTCAARYLLHQVESEWLGQAAGMLARYDSQKALQPILHQVMLTRRLSNEPTLRMWIQNSADMSLQHRVSDILRRYRTTMGETRLHLVLDVNAPIETASVSDVIDFQYAALAPTINGQRQLDETTSVSILHPDDGREAWLQVRTLMIANQQILGFVETETNLRDLPLPPAESQTQGVLTLLLNVDGQPLLTPHADDASSPASLKMSQPSELDWNQVNMMMQRQRAGQEPLSILMHHDDASSLVALNYLPELDWFELNILQAKHMPVLQHLNAFYWLLMAIIWGMSFLWAFTMDTVFIHPIRRIHRKMFGFVQSQASSQLPLVSRQSTSEIRQIMTMTEHCQRMVFEAKQQVETQVAERTLALNRLSTVDPLTQLLNRRGMDTELRAELARCRRECRVFGLLWVEVGQFQSIQSSLGHEAAESVLHHVVNIIQLNIREYDAACRWGDNEFQILVRNDSAQSLQSLAERLCKQCEVPVHIPAINTSLVVPLSVGGTLVSNENDINDVLAKADGALYFAKQDARQNIHIWRSESTGAA
ncbi:GGDEF domain-containing protein [Vibrio furnissii]|uniref:GGDEF domain-containing protein n=1 Tax=Vibrio furnissii TaxID=29494 RepID=UPI001558480F|nr:GGDEF domain-containing protein [Vibrio furnissii]